MPITPDKRNRSDKPEEASSRHSEERLRTLFECAPDAYYLSDFSGTFVDGNRAAERLTGYGRDELIGKNFLNLGILPANQIPRAVALLAKNATGRSTGPDEFTLRRKDGTMVPMEVNTHPVSIGNQKLVLGIARDISERRRSGQPLKASEQRFRALIEHSHDAITMLAADGTVMFDSPSITRILGYTPEERIGRKVFEFVHPDDRHGMQEGFEAFAGQPGQTMSYQGRFLHKDGTIRWTESVRTNLLHERMVEAIVVNYRDISERIKNEKDLRREVAFNAMLLENAAEGFCVCHGIQEYPHVRFTVWNRHMTELTGYTVEEINRLGWYQTFYPDVAVRERAIDRMTRMRQGDNIVGEEWEIVRKDGTKIVLSISTSVIASEAGSIHVLAVMRDTTERKQAESELRKAHDDLAAAVAELKRTQQQIIQSERLRALGQMASGVAHDFNNALMPILGYADLVLSDHSVLDDKPNMIDMFKDLHNAATDAAKTIRRLREFYRPMGKEDSGPLDINDAVKSAVSYTRPRWQEEMRAKGVFIEMELDLGDTPSTEGNESEVREAVVNLIFNSVDAIAAKGKISIRTFTGHGWAVLKVTDTGAGMTEEVRQRCFDPFFSTKGRHGSGLGLSMVHGIVQRHGGAIRIDSAPGAGTTVTIEWPPAKPHEDTFPEAAPTEAVVAPQMRILCIDDELPVAKTVSRFLSADGHAVTLAQDGEKGIELFRQEPFDVVIVDRAMPKMNGDRVAQAIKAGSPDTPVIMLTGFGRIMEDQRDTPTHVDLVVGKPVTRADLRTAIAGVLARKK